MASAQEPQELLGADATILQREPQVRPALLGADPIDKLRNPDATAGLDLIEAPTPDHQGNAALDLPLSIPRGRAGVQPELAIAYDSGGDAGWLGTGWDLGVGEITIDTRWGVPRYSDSHETETYTLDGDVLGPTAVRADGDLDERIDGRVEFTRRVENEFERVIRHGDHPSNYWWEVHDKNGGVRWYGGTPDQGGVLGHRDPGSGLDEDAVLRTHTGGPIFRWALSAQRDSYANLIRYEYEQDAGERVGRDGDAVGTQLYLERILYTAALPVSGHEEDPAYEIRFLRDDDVEGESARKDVTVDATGGFLQVTSDLLRRVEVWTGKANEDESLRTFDMLVKAWNLSYEEGAFGKSLLASVEQRDRDDQPVGKHDFEYYDEVRNEDGEYEGFEGTDDLDTQDDHLDAKVLNPFGVSALGSSNAFSADARVYIGFSPTGPTKSTSAGVGLAINGGYTETLLELIDLNGDQLPDKVFREGPGHIKFRLNQARPRGGSREFSGGGDVGGLGKLSDEFSIGFGVGVEGYIASASLSFNVGANVSVGESYFEDVNDDGLPDFVQAGRVRFNHLDDDGVPHFTSSSEPTRVPIGTSNLDPSELADLEDLKKLEEEQDENSPPLDTVRRWVAPYTGIVTIDAPVTLEPPPDTRVPRPPAYDGDGVRVAVQRGGEELWVARLERPGDSATPSGVAAVNVIAGQAVYFRAQAVDHGALDQVRWDPRIAYADIAGISSAPSLDVNGRSQRVFQASEDFSLAGRPAPKLFMPLQGTVHLEGVLTKLRPTSDDIRVLVRRNGAPVVDHVIDDQQVYPDGLDLSTDFDVAAPTEDGVDVVTVEVVVDSAIDVSALRWAPRLYYVSAVDEHGEPVPTTDEDTGEPSIEITTPPAIDVYPARFQTRPVEPWESGTDGDQDLRVDFLHSDDMKPGRVVVAVKQRTGLVKKTSGTIRTDDGLPTSSSVTLHDVPVAEDEEYWVEIAVRDSETIKAIKGTAVLLGGAIPIPHQLYGQPQDIFPPGYRNWAYAGYNGAGERATQPIDEEAFKFDEDDYSDRNPADFEDDGFNNQKRKGDPFVPVILDLLDEDREVVGHAPVWRGAKDNIVGGAGFARTSRKGVDDPKAIPQPSDLPAGGGDGVRAVRKVGITGPTFSFAAGFLVANASFTGGPSFGLMDYTDMNGDGFPDIVAPGYIKYTGPRGDYVDTPGDGVATVSQDVTFGVGGGFAGTTGSIKANAEGDVSTSQDVASTSGSDGTSGVAGSGAGNDSDEKELWGFSIGGSFGVQAQFTNPGMPADALSEGIAELSGDVGPALEKELADVNGDGLPDEVLVDFTDIRVRLNTGYGFSDPIPWSLGGFEASESYSGTFGANLGFQFNKKEFSGGLSYTEDVDFPRYTWVDVDGDGVLDRLRKDGTKIKVAFGTGAGVMDEVDYGDFTEGSIDLVGNIFNGAGIPTGQQVSQSRGRNLSAGVDFTFGIGPLCVPTPLCYIIVNPGVHLDYGVSNSVVGLTDVNGDGYPDSVRSNGDEGIEVRRNTRGRTNLLRSVKTPLGGEIRLGYERYGNTVEQPFSQWALSSVEDDDGRPGDGPDVLLRTYEYEDGAYDPLEREMLGYGKVIERQREFEDDGDVFDDQLLRSVERTYRNSTVFNSGLQTSEKLVSPGGAPVRETRSEWEVVDLATGEEMTVTDPVARLGRAGAPLRTELEQRWYDGDGNVGQRTRNTFEYDRLGNIVRQVDHGELETEADDLTAVTTYSNCELSASEDLKETFPCGPDAGPPTDPDAPPLPARRHPLDDQRGCGTWLSVPVRFTVRDAEGHVLRERDGAPLACDNAGVSILEERLGDGEVAVTELGYDDFGSYDSITYPENADGERLSVVYEFDPHAHANIARTTEVRGELDEDGEAAICEDQPALCATATAEYDERTGLISSRTDPNDQTTSYEYDPVGRIQSIRGPYEQDGGDPASITFEYHPTDPDYAWAIARHHDVQHPDDPIETVSFVDGRGRETETKQDATVHRGVAQDAEDVMVVSGAVEFDALGRPVKEWFPTEEPLGTAGDYKYTTSPVKPTRTSYSLSDRVTEVVHPNDAVTRTSYGYGAAQAGGPIVFDTKATDRNGKVQHSFTDVRQHVLAVHDGTPPLRTSYRYDPMGQLVEVVEPGGARTAHTYDLVGRRTSTRTPDTGLTTLEFDPSGNLVAKVTPVLRAAGQQTAYEYDHDRLVKVEQPEGNPDVTYEWGDGEAGDNAVGRVTHVVDGARDQRLTYDRLGEVEQETTTMLVHNLNDAVGERVTYETSFTYDTFGRLQTLTYPDGEVLRHRYDSGGLLRAMDGEKGDDDYRYLDRLEYDEFLDRRLQLTGNDVATVYNYDPRTRLMVRQVTNTPAREVQDLNYDYDLEGNVERLDNTLPPPVPELFGGPGWQDYTYDQHYRLTKASGSYSFAPKKTRTYSLSTSYDAHGNTATKAQTDRVQGRDQKPTTYDFGRLRYDPQAVHQVRTIGSRSYTHDADGNQTGWTDARTGQNRTMEWDAAGDLRSVADNGSTTRYTYDGDGTLALERGPSGETAFVNPWWTVRNATQRTKHFWAGGDRLAHQLVMEDEREHKRYFLHKDLQGSTNVVTADDALVYQHLEHFPSGETWVREQSDEHRTPYQHAGGYFDEVRGLTRHGARWYEPREQLFQSADPLLSQDPEEVVDDPALLPAYTYAESNPLRLSDAGGRAPNSVRSAFTGALGDLVKLRRRGQPHGLFAVEAANRAVAVVSSVLAARAQGGDADARAAADRARDRQPAPAENGGASVQAQAAAVAGEQQDDQRSSRLWGTKAEAQAAEKRIKKFTDFLEVKPLIEIQLVKGKDGWRLKDVKGSPGVFFQKSLLPKSTRESLAKKPEVKVDPTAPASDADPKPDVGAS